MQDRPTAEELLAAVRTFLQQEILPTLVDHRLKFRTLIAANVLAVVERELQGDEQRLRHEWERLSALLPAGTAEQSPSTLESLRAALDHGHRALCARIRAGEADTGPWGEAVRAFVLFSVEEKLRVSNPRYLAVVMEQAGE